MCKSRDEILVGFHDRASAILYRYFEVILIKTLTAIFSSVTQTQNSNSTHESMVGV